VYLFIRFYLIVCCFSVIWALLPEINVMIMMMITRLAQDRHIVDWMV